MNVASLSRELFKGLVVLKEFPNWVGGNSPKKIPLNPQTNKNAQSNNPQTWGSYDQALEAQKTYGWDLIGFCCHPETIPLAFIDLDHCIIDGDVQPWAMEIIKAVNSYTEVSPSGEGIHILAYGYPPGNIPALKAKAGEVALVGEPPKIPEIYHKERWFTITGDHVPGTPETIEDRPREVAALYGETKGQFDSYKKRLAEAKRRKNQRPTRQKSQGQYNGNDSAYTDLKAEILAAYDYDTLLRFVQLLYPGATESADHNGTRVTGHGGLIVYPDPQPHWKNYSEGSAADPVGGDVFNLAALHLWGTHKVEGRDFHEAMIMAAKFVGIDVDVRLRESRQAQNANGSDPAPVIVDQATPAAALHGKEPVTVSPGLEDLYQKALSAPDESKLAVLAQMASDPSLSDPLVLDFWASKVKESGLCNVGAFKEAYRRNAPASDKTLIKSAEYINVLKSLGYDFRLNLCDDSLEINGERSSDPTRAKIRTQMRDAGYEQVNVIEDAYLAYATDKAYHPVREYFDSLKWDRRPHIAKFASHFIDKHGNAELWFRKWLIGAINRAFTGQQNPMLVLEGSQDLGKSYAARWLCPLKGYHHEGPIRADNKDHTLRLIKRFIWEVGELEAVTTREDVAALKDFLTKEEVGERKAYGHDDTVKPALAVFIGTVNDNGAGFLRDTTGNRRFLVCSLVHINWDYAKLDVNQIWAEAVHAWRDGESWRLTKAEAKKRDTINEQFMPEDPMEIRLNQHFYLDKSKNLVPATEAEQLVCSDKWWWVSSSDIYDKLQHYTKLANTEKGFYMSLANTMKRLGHEKHKVGKANGYIGVMVKPT